MTDRSRRKRALVTIKTIACIGYLVLLVTSVSTSVLYFQAVRGLDNCEHHRIEAVYKLHRIEEQTKNKEGDEFPLHEIETGAGRGVGLTNHHLYLQQVLIFNAVETERPVPDPLSKRPSHWLSHKELQAL